MVSDLASWTLKISQQQEENDKLQREENERLEQDIATARKAREARKSGFRSPGMSHTSRFQAPPTSSPSIPALPSSSTSRSNGPKGLNNIDPSSSARQPPPPSSLASMMGSSEAGPRLTRAPAGGDGMIGTSSHAAGGVGLPGLARGGGVRTGGGGRGGVQQEQEIEAAPSRWNSSAATSSSTLGESLSKTLSPVKSVTGGYQHKSSSSSTLPFERAPLRSTPSTKLNDPSSPTTSTSASASTPRPFAFTSQRSSTVPVPASTSSSSSQQHHRSQPSYGNSSTSPTTPSASLLLRPIPIPTPAPPVLSGSTAAPSQAFTRPSSSERGPTASLTRLKGRGIVEEQLRKSRLREEGEESGLAGISEFGSPALGGGGWDGSGSGGKATASPRLTSNGSGGFPRSLQRSPSFSSAPSTTTHTTTSTATAQPFLPPTSSATDAFPVLRPTRRHQTSASISQIPSQPPLQLSTAASRHRPTSSVGKLPMITSLAKEEAISREQQQPLRVRTTGKLFASRQTTQEPTSFSSPAIPQIPGSPRVSVRSFVKNVETSSSPLVVESAAAGGRRQFGGPLPAISFPSSSSQPTRSNTTPYPLAAKPSRTASPTSTITHRVLPPPRRTTTSITSSASDSHSHSALSPSSPPLSNPYSAFFAPASSSSSNTPAAATIIPRPPSPIKPSTNQGIGLPGLALPSDLLSSSRRYLDRATDEPKHLERKDIKGAGLPGIVASAVEEVVPIAVASPKKAPILSPPTSPTKPEFDERERSSSPIKRASYQPTTTMVAPARPGSPTKVAFPLSKEETKGPASPTKRSFDVVASIIKESKEQVEPVARGGGAGGGVGVLKSFATPVRVRKENRGSITNSTSETGAAGDAGVGEEKLPISPSGGLFHPTRDRARKPKPKNSRTSLTTTASSPSAKPTLVEAIPPVPTARESPTKPSFSSSKPSFDAPAPPPSPTKPKQLKSTLISITAVAETPVPLPPPSPIKRDFVPSSGRNVNVAQRRSVWGDQAPIGVAPLSSYAGQETADVQAKEVKVVVEEKEKVKVVEGERKGPKGTFGGKALPGMVFVEKKDKEVIIEKKKEQEQVKKVVVVEEKKKETRVRRADPPFPIISIRQLLASHPSTSTNTHNTTSTALPLTLSLEVLSISTSGSTTTLLPPNSNDPWIFYASELLAVVHRSKSRETGLVSSKVWGWRGRRFDEGDGEGKGRKKMEEVGRRLSVGVIEVKQGEENEELMSVLGGKLVIRQGERDHFSSENTALYTIQQSKGSILIDEVDLLPSFLTSRHSLLLTVLSQVFLYHGRGSLRSERIAGRQHAALLARDSPSEFIELEEDGRKTEDHELFWMCFGEEEGEGSRAEHWRFRSELEEDEVKGWKVEKGKITSMESLFAGEVFGPGIKILLLSFEIFVVVSEEARGRTSDVRFALHVASRMEKSRSIGATRPFNPPVHALILPSKIPSDLKPYFRYLEEDEINGAVTPSHTNVLSLAQAKEHLAQRSWPTSMLSDESFLPLGVAPK